MSENCFWRPSSLLAWSSMTLSTDDITFARSSPSVLSFSPSPDYSAHAHMHIHTHAHTHTSRHRQCQTWCETVNERAAGVSSSSVIGWLVGWSSTSFFSKNMAISETKAVQWTHPSQKHHQRKKLVNWRKLTRWKVWEQEWSAVTLHTLYWQLEFYLLKSVWWCNQWQLP